jgi:hypothetical protein
VEGADEEGGVSEGEVMMGWVGVLLCVVGWDWAALLVGLFMHFLLGLSGQSPLGWIGNSSIAADTRRL